MFSQYPNGFDISPYLQEKLVFFGQLEVDDQPPKWPKPIGTFYRVEANLPAQQPPDLGFISDGALWLRQLMTTHYPQARQCFCTIDYLNSFYFLPETL